MVNDFTKLVLVICVVITYFLLSFGAYFGLDNISPMSSEINFGIAFIIVLGFYVGAGFAFKKLRLF